MNWIPTGILSINPALTTLAHIPARLAGRLKKFLQKKHHRSI